MKLNLMIFGILKISITEMKGNRKIHLTGLLGNSAMSVSDSKITIHNDELNIILFEALARVSIQVI